MGSANVSGCNRGVANAEVGTSLREKGCATNSLTKQNVSMLKGTSMVQKIVQSVELEGKRLVHINKEWHARKRGGKDVCWLVIDREKEYVFLAQKLVAIANYINSILSDGSKSNVVSMQGMYTNVDGTEKLNGGWHKGRWGVK